MSVPVWNKGIALPLVCIVREGRIPGDGRGRRMSRTRDPKLGPQRQRQRVGGLTWFPHAAAAPRIPVHKAARVLGGLYFATRDPFLSHKEARTVLLQVPEQRGAVRKRDAVCRGFDPQWVAAVLEGSGAARHAARTHSGPAWEPEGGGESESYDSSFIDDDDGPSATNSAESGEVESS